MDRLTKNDIIIDCSMLFSKSNKDIYQSQSYLSNFGKKSQKEQYLNRLTSLGFNSFFCSYNHELLKILNKKNNFYFLLPDISR